MNAPALDQCGMFSTQSNDACGGPRNLGTCEQNRGSDYGAKKSAMSRFTRPGASSSGK